MDKIRRIVIFASGAGSNARNIVEHFKMNANASVSGICTNNPNSGVVSIARQNNIKCIVFSKDDLYAGDSVDKFLSSSSPDLIVLAGFLLKFPARILARFHKKVINLHPSLLPKFGGKGMYGARVHQAVIEANETVSGITVHYVNEEYDDGAVIAQYTCDVHTNDGPEVLQNKIKALEDVYFPRTIETLIS